MFLQYEQKMDGIILPSGKMSAITHAIIFVLNQVTVQKRYYYEVVFMCLCFVSIYGKRIVFAVHCLRIYLATKRVSRIVPRFL